MDKYYAREYQAEAKKLVDDAWNLAREKNPGSGRFAPEVVGFACGCIQYRIESLMREIKTLKERTDARPMNTISGKLARGSGRK